MQKVPLTEPPTYVLAHGAVRESQFPGPNSYPFRNGFWVLNLMGGTGELEVEGVRQTFTSGCAVLTPPGVWHTYHVTRTVPFIHAHFRAFGNDAPIPMIQALGAEIDAMRVALRDAGRRLTAEPARATAALWHILWQLASGPAHAVHAIHHPVITRVLAHLADHLPDPLDPDFLAVHCGVTPRHLNRLCGSAFGMPLAAYVRDQRLQLARHLLENSEMGIRDIASSVGYPDLQHFCKLVRNRFGATPSQLRGRRHSTAGAT